MFYGMPFSVALDCPRLCLIMWRICLHAGGQVVVCYCMENGSPLPYGRNFEDQERTLEEFKSLFFFFTLFT